MSQLLIGPFAFVFGVLSTPILVNAIDSLLNGKNEMKMRNCLLALSSWCIAAVLIGCGQSTPTKVESKSVGADMPTFTMWTSEYPSWSTFSVAQKAGLIGKSDGAPGTLEKKWGVRIKLEVKDYDSCLAAYGSGTIDAVCMTNIDALNPAMTRPSTAIMPTSTSAGADKVLAVGFNNIADLKNYITYGLDKSVSRYNFYRGLEVKGENPDDYKFENLDPAAVATAIQTKSDKVKAGSIWNPFALQTVRSSNDITVLWTSELIPEEIIDMVFAANDSLNKPGGDKFASLICDIQYSVCRKMNDEKTADITFKALGEDFCKLDVPDMKICCHETSFYASPEDGIKLFSNPNFQNNKMPKVIQTCHTIKILEGDEQPTIGWNDNSKQLNFSTKYMESVLSPKN